MSSPKWRYRSSVTGLYVTEAFALANERETYRVPTKQYARKLVEQAERDEAPAENKDPSVGGE